MLLFLKGFIIGIAKIIPGVSGAIVAINFKVYERLINALTSFFDDWKENLKFLLILFLGMFCALVFASRIILYLLSVKAFITLMFFVGLLIGGTYNFGKSLVHNYKTTIISFIFFIGFTFLSFLNINRTYVLSNSFLDNIVFFFGGIIEIFASIFPGISATSLLMILGIYEHVLKIVANIIDFSYVISHINLYLSYGIGMFVSFMINVHLIKLLFNKYKTITYSAILGLSIASIIFLISLTFQQSYHIIDFILGVMLLVIGILVSCILDN